MTVDPFGSLNSAEEREIVRNLALSGNDGALAGHEFVDAKDPTKKSYGGNKEERDQFYKIQHIMNAMSARTTSTPLYTIKIDNIEYNDKQIKAALDIAHEETTQEIERLEKDMEDMRERGEAPASVDLRAVEALKQFEKKQKIEEAKEAAEDPEKLKKIVKGSLKIKEIIKEKAPPKDQVAETDADAETQEPLQRKISVAPEEDALNDMEIKEHFASAVTPSEQISEPAPEIRQPARIPDRSPEAFA